MFEINIKAKKLQLKSELNTITCGTMSTNDYAFNIKSIVESLGSIKVTVDHDGLVGACLECLGEQYTHFNSSINMRENIPHFAGPISKIMGLDTLRTS